MFIKKKTKQNKQNRSTTRPTQNYIRPIWFNCYCYVQYCTKKECTSVMYNIVYTKYLSTGFSSNTETTINIFDIMVSFFLSSLISNGHKNAKHSGHIIPTQLVHTHAKFKCTKTDLRLTESSPRFCFIEHCRDKTHQPTTCMSVCRRVCASHHQHTRTNTHKHIHVLSCSLLLS